MENKFETILNSLKGKPWEIPEIITNIVILKHFLKQELPFLNFFQEKSNSESKKYIKNLILGNTTFFDNNYDLESGLHQLGSEFAGKMKNYEDIKILTQEISKFDEKELKDFYNCFLDLLERSSYKIGFSSPKEINLLAKNILNPTSGTFYSPTFRVGKEIIETFGNNNLSFYGQEDSYQNFLLAKIYLELNGVKGSIKQGFFKDDKFEGKKFDYAFSIPPFGLRDENIKGDGDYFFINRLLEHLKDYHGKGVIVLPFSSTFKKTNDLMKQREQFIKSGFLESIILLPTGSFKPYTGIDTSLWVFNKNKLHKYVFFIDGRNSNVEEISNTYISKFEVKNLSKFRDYNNIEKYDFNLNPGLYVNGLIEEIKILEENQELPKLKKFIDIEVPKEILDGMPKKIQELMKKGKIEGKITQDEIILALPQAEDDLDFLDEMYTRFLKLNIEIVGDGIYFEDLSSDEIRNYLSEISKYELLSSSEEKNLFSEKSEDNKEKLYNSYLRYVVSISKKYAGKGVKLLELLEVGGKGLKIAIEKYKLGVKIPFSTYALVWIEKEICKKLGLKGDFDDESLEKMLNFEEIEKEEKEAKKEEKEDLEKQLKDKENNQKSKNLENITKLNDKIHEEILNFLNYDSLNWNKIYPRFFYKIQNNDWYKQVKDSMRLANIISLNSYIYNNDENKKIEKQFDLVKYFDEQLDKEWKLEAKKEYARKLFTILKLETFLLFIVIGYVFYRYDIESLIKLFDLLKWFFGLTLGQMTLMVFTIVKYLFPNGEKNEGK